MKTILPLVIVYLTFMLSINLKLLKSAFGEKSKSTTKIQTYNTYIWFGIILLMGLIGLDAFYLARPTESISFSVFLVVLLVMIPFWVTSEYRPEKSIKGIVNFCLIFPIGEEILFRGVILYTASFLLSGISIYVPVPLLKGVTLQVFISAVCFAITHFQYFGFNFTKDTLKKVLFAFIFGIFAGNLVEITGSIMYTVVLHILANTGAAIYHFRKYDKKSLEV